MHYSVCLCLNPPPSCFFLLLSPSLSLPARSLSGARARSLRPTPPPNCLLHIKMRLCAQLVSSFGSCVCVGRGGGGWYSNTIACPNTLDAFGPCFPFFNVRTCFMRLVRVHAFGPCFPLFLLCRTAIHMGNVSFRGCILSLRGFFLSSSHLFVPLHVHSVCDASKP
jgi:hypothetical protein